MSERSLGRLLLGLMPVLLLLDARPASAQCNNFISTFPHQEGFEGAPVWAAGGTASDWAWGTPAKPLIDGPGEGANSWCIGGLTGSGYSNGQQSWLESPCFDLSPLTYPWVSFKLFWETERGYDGLGFQYSLNEGQTWSNVGSFMNTQHCLNANWFNSVNITGLNLAQPKQGWSGRVGATAGNCAGGDGSGDWLTATHCLDMIAGATSVKFRFVFGAGTICNGYDGIGIDDFRIGEAPSNVPYFSFSCNGLTVNFQDDSGLCPTSRTWNFGDPASGASNTSTLTNPAHTFPGPGTYQVQLTVSGPCNAPASITLPVTILGVELEVTDPGCAGNDGNMVALVSGGAGPYTYVWDPGGIGTATLSGLGAGDYTLTVEGTDACPAQASATLVEQVGTLAVSAVVTDERCAGSADGSITLTVDGGEAPLSYAWEPAVSNGPVASDLPPGTYTCEIADADACGATITLTVNGPEPLVLDVQDDAILCAGASLMLTATASGGTPGYELTWSPSGPEVAPLANTTYTVVATDANGCSTLPAEVLVQVGGPAPPVFVADELAGCLPLCVTFTAQSPDPGELIWDLGDGTAISGPTSIQHCYTSAGSNNVSLTLIDDLGCEATTLLPAPIEVFPQPEVAFTVSPPVATIGAPTFTFMDASSGALLWTWSFGDGSDSAAEGPVTQFTYSAVGCYPVELEASSAQGCVGRAGAVVCVEDEFALYAPNAFTPNGDGINDVFGVVSTVRDPSQFVLQVFDRWGRMVFETGDPRQGWEARDLPQGVYAWQVQLRDSQEQLRQAAGHVTLLR